MTNERGDLHVGFDETDAKSGGAGLGLAIRFGLRGGKSARSG